MQAISNAADLAFPPDVRAFCDDHGIVDHLRLALRLAAQTFQLDGDPRLTLETDPETDEESVAIDVLSHMNCDEPWTANANSRCNGSSPSLQTSSA
jgi:hypothetical protein